jgi:hypothetical protein
LPHKDKKGVSPHEPFPPPLGIGAKWRGHDVQAELALYVIHGLLHLCGYDGRDPADAAAMRARERHYLALLGLPDIAPGGDNS